MNKNLLIGVVIAVVVIAAAGYFFLNRSASNPQNTTKQEQTGQTMEKRSFKDLLTFGTNQTCTFSDKESGSSGNIYVGDGNARGDFTTTSNGVDTGSHMILDSKTMYIWTDAQPNGFKISRDAMEKVQESIPDNGPQMIDINKQVDYDCSSWSVDTAKFAPPSDVTFGDFSNMMENASKMMKDSGAGDMMKDNQAACSACANLPAEAQAQCKATLKCN